MKEKYYLIPYYKDDNSQLIYAYLYIKNLINPHVKNKLVERENGSEFKSALSKKSMWFCNGYPAAFGGNMDDNESIAKCLRREFEEEAGQHFSIEYFQQNWTNFKSKDWKGIKYKYSDTHNKPYGQQEKLTFYMLPLNAKFSIQNNDETDSKQELTTDEQESTKEFIELTLSQGMSGEDIVKQAKDQHKLGKDRIKEDKVQEKLDNSIKNLQLKNDKESEEKAKKCFWDAFNSQERNPEQEFLKSDTVKALIGFCKVICAEEWE